MSDEKSGPPKSVIQYTEEFLRRFRDVKYDVPESIKKSYLYIHAPKPPVHRPRVDRSRSKEGGRNKNFLSSAERQELQRRRKDEEKKRQNELAGKEPFQTPQKTATQRSPTSPGPQSPEVPPSSDELQPTSASEETETEGEATAAAIIQDAQEQQLALSVPDPESTGVANKPEARSLLPRVKKSLTVETDERRLHQRLKQIEYGKVTHGYKCYMALKPRNARTKQDPHTPNALQKCSKRSWDGQVRKWRRQLHKYDDLAPAGETEDTSATSGNEMSASDTEGTPARPTRTAAQPPAQPPSATKTPTLSKEERDELARKRKEFEDMKSTPQKTSPKTETAEP